MAGTRVAIIGAGFAGLGVAVELLTTHAVARNDIVILERGDTVGGVWRENTYPGAACDVPSPYYSFSFAPNPRWPRRFSRQPDILAYLEDVADRYGLRDRIRFGTEVVAADWDDAAGRWVLTLSDDDSVTAEVLVPAVGQLSRPARPSIDGRDTFAGPAFHSAEWDHDVDLAGRRVAVIGTGASAIQFVPEIAPHVAHLDVFQRTPPYLLPRPDTEFRASRHALFERVPAALAAERGGWWAFTEAVTVAFLYSRPLNVVLRAMSRSHMSRQVRDADLLAKVWPAYDFGCKRVLFSSDYLPALGAGNVELVTDGIARIVPEGVETVDGTVHPADVIVYGTGFTATDFLAPMRLTGRGGATLDDVWHDGASAYLGITVPRMPNLFLMYGPNTNLGSGSIVFMLECQARYVRQAVERIALTAQPLEVDADAARRFDTAIQERLVDGVWSRCRNWYRNASGRVTTNWPGTVTEYRRRTAEMDPDDYRAPVPA